MFPRNRVHLITILLVLSVIGMGITPVFAADTRADVSPSEKSPSIQSPIAQQNTTNTSVNETNATVTIENQTTDGLSITVRNATIPTDGFAVLHGPTHLEGIGAPQPIAVSDPLDAGPHQNITINASSGVPGSQSNRTNFSANRYVVRLYPDTNDNDKFDYYRGRGADEPYEVPDLRQYIVDRNPYLDVGLVLDENSTAASSAQQNRTSPAIEFSGRTTPSSNRTIIVDSVTLPQGGYITVYNQQYLPPNNATVDAVIGHSRHLTNGTHRDINVTVYNMSGFDAQRGKTLQQGQQVVVSPAYDSNGTHTYDFVSSDGTTDVPYISNGTRVTAVAPVQLTGNATESPSASTDTTENATGPLPTPTGSTTTDPTATTTNNTTAQPEQQQGMATVLMDMLSPSVLFLILVVMVGIVTVARRIWSGRDDNGGLR